MASGDPGSEGYPPPAGPPSSLPLAGAPSPPAAPAGPDDPPPAYPPPAYPPYPGSGVAPGEHRVPAWEGGDGGGDDRPPRSARDGWFWVVCAVVGFLAGQVLSAVVLVVVAEANGQSHDLSALVARAVPPAWVVVCGLVGLWMGFLGAVVFASRRRGTGRVLRDMRWGFGPWDPAIGVLTGVLGQFVLLPLLYLPVQFFVPHLSDKLSQPAKHLTGGFPGADVAVIALLTVVVVPIVEELTFRGLVLRGLLRACAGAGRVLGPVIAVIGTGIAFGLAHAEALEFLGLMAFGIVLSVLAYKFDRLGPSIFAHGTFNLLAVLLVVYGGSLRPAVG
ncbi:MAG TPA: CPBP family intramembrane glutamic endopeptidase [Acidimicrobiales bacterium]|nr:CPBP family intramembrane glutamic endopeptidase [Acidimicrobiales bacterium]